MGGRGAYYRAKYGGGRGRGGGGGGGGGRGAYRREGDTNAADSGELGHSINSSGSGGSGGEHDWREGDVLPSSLGFSADAPRQHRDPYDAPPSSSSLESFFMSVNGANYGQLKALTGRTYPLPLPPSHPAGANGGNGSSSSRVLIHFHSIQSDPFAPGSQISVRVPWDAALAREVLRPTGGKITSPNTTTAATATEEARAAEGLNPAAPAAALLLPPLEEWGVRCVAAEDFILRRFQRALPGGGGGGALRTLRISPHVIARSAVRTEADAAAADAPAGVPPPPSRYFTVYLRLKLPGHGRRIDGPGAVRLLARDLAGAVSGALLRLPGPALLAHVESVLDQEWLRRALPGEGLVAFVRDGAVLPRAAGDSEGPLAAAEAVPFASPPSLARRFTLPYSGAAVSGMGLPRGLTLIAGGGFHGKSTLLRALELGVYNHVPGDGRELVVADAAAVKIRAEDRRSVHGVDISPFISNLPLRKDTACFATADASGSTSQAANIMEALELGCTTLLLDEDTSATNFMYRDALMERLVPRAREPITPFVERIGDLMRARGTSAVIVVGGSGQYFPHATTVLVLNAYRVEDATEQVRQIVRDAAPGSFLTTTPPAASAGSDNHNHNNSGIADADASSRSRSSSSSVFARAPQRHLEHSRTFASIPRSGGRGRYAKMSAVGLERLRLGEEEVQLGLVEQLVEEGQLNSIVQIIALLYDGSEEITERVQSPAFPCASPPNPPSLCAQLVAHITANNSNRSHHNSNNSNNNNNNKDDEEETRATPAAAAATAMATAALPPPAAVSDFCTLVHNCEKCLRQQQLELRSPSGYLPLGWSALPRAFEIGASLNRLRTLCTRSVKK